MISSYIGSHHAKWYYFLQHFAYNIRAVHASTDKTFAELCFEKGNYYTFSEVVTVSGSESEFMCQDVDYLVKEVQVQNSKA